MTGSSGSSAIGVDLGATKTTAGLVLPDGEIRCEATVPTPAAAGGSAVVETTAALVRTVLADARAAGLPPPRVLGVGSAGVVDRCTGTITSATDHIRDWVGTSLARLLTTASGLDVHVLNDVHAHAVGEARCGAGHGKRSVLVVAVGTGVGGALVVDGQPLGGAHGAAGHLGHVPVPEADGVRCPCGRTGHVEGLASGPGLFAAYERLAGKDGRDVGGLRDAREVMAAGDAGDELAHRAVVLAASALGRALGGWVNSFDPDLVVLTGGLATAGPQWWDQVVAAAAGEYVPAVRSCPVVPATLGSRAALVGAAGFALDRERAAPVVKQPR